MIASSPCATQGKVVFMRVEYPKEEIARQPISERQIEVILIPGIRKYHVAVICTADIEAYEEGARTLFKHHVKQPFIPPPPILMGLGKTFARIIQVRKG